MLSRITLRLPNFSCFLLAPLFFSSATLAQDFQHLLFEPSLLNDQPASTATAGSSAAPSMAAALPATAVGTTMALKEFLADQGDPSSGQLNTINADIANYKKVIQDLELEGGVYEAKLSEELLALASLYQKSGALAEAQEILNRAAYIARVNNGLYDASQIPLLKKVIENYVELGDLLAADQQQEALFYMQRKLYGDTSAELLPGLKYFAEWNVFVATTNIVPPPVAEDGKPGASPIVDMMSFQFQHLVDAQNLYDRMAQIFIASPGFDETHLAEAEKQILVIAHLFATRFNTYIGSFEMANFSGFSAQSPTESSLLRRNDLSYRTGTDILQGRVTRLQEQSAPDPQKIGKAKIELADWLLVFSRRLTALDLLEETYRELTEASAPQDLLDLLFNPAVPQQIPAFLNTPYSRASLGIPEEAALQYRGYIDMEFKVNRFGIPFAMTVLGTSPETDEEITARLLNHIRYSQFRPRLQEGVAKNDDRFELRYHYTY